jgi:predicted MFS family arabinose efflux permease
MDVSMNAHAVEVERGYERPIMGAFHAYFSLGGLAAALVGGPLIAAEVYVLLTLVAASAAGILATLACARWVLSARPQRRERSRTAVGRRLRWGGASMSSASACWRSR